MSGFDDVRAQNGGALVSNVAFMDEGVVLDVEFNPEDTDGIRVLKRIGIEFDHEEYGAQAFEIFKLATELGFEVNSDPKILKRH